MPLLMPYLMVPDGFVPNVFNPTPLNSVAAVEVPFVEGHMPVC